MMSSCAPSDQARPRARRLVLCVASTGGHFVQLRRITSGLQGDERFETHFASTFKGDAKAVAWAPHHLIPDASRLTPWRVLWSALCTLALVWRLRPAVVVTTGAAPGYLALRAGHLLGARTLWIDSVANIEEVSLSAQLARPYADTCLSQWPGVGAEFGTIYQGSVL